MGCIRVSERGVGSVRGQDDSWMVRDGGGC